jgi:hypothetical protein
MRKACSLLLAAAVATLGGAALTGCSSSGSSGLDHSRHSHTGHSHGVDQYYPKAKAYPLTKCLVTDEGFNLGKPYRFIHEGQEIKLCCKDCRADFKKEPAKYLSKLNAPK